MLKIIKKILLLFVISLLTFLLVACDEKNNQVLQPRENIELGFIAPLSGDAAVIGESERAAVKLAVDEINQAGGIADRQVRIIYEDGKCTNKDGNTAANKLISVDKVKIILGGICSAETLGAAPVAEENQVILFAAFSSSPDITMAGDYVFRNVPKDTDKALIDPLVSYLKKYNSIAFISENTDYSLGVKKGLKEQFNEYSINIIGDQVFNNGEKDFKTYLTKIKSKQPEVLFINPGSDPELPYIILKQAKELGLDSAIFGNFMLGGGNYYQNEPELFEGVIFYDVPMLDESDPKVKEFKHKYSKLDNNPYSWWEVGARYDSVYIIKNALEECGENTECIKNYLYNMDWYEGVIGRYKFDENGDVVGLKGVAKTIRNGKIEVLE